MQIVLMCTVLMAAYPWQRGHSDRIATCIYVASKAESLGEDPSLIVSLAWSESRFNWKAKSKQGAIGPLQVIPKYWCKGRKKCERIEAGLRALTWWRAHANDKGVKWCTREWMIHALCRYNAGYRCGRKSRAWAATIMGRAEWLNEIAAL